jgi:hypothetical protein
MKYVRQLLLKKYKYSVKVHPFLFINISDSLKEYFLNILPRLKELSSSLDKKEIFIDQPWVLIDDNFKKHQYIFKRDG